MLELLLIAIFFFLFIFILWFIAYTNDFDKPITCLAGVFTVILILIFIAVLISGGETELIN